MMMITVDLKTLRTQYGKRLTELRDSGIPEDNTERVAVRTLLMVLEHAIEGDAQRQKHDAELAFVTTERDLLKATMRIALARRK